jgi:hypothetical protein
MAPMVTLFFLEGEEEKRKLLEKKKKVGNPSKDIYTRASKQKFVRPFC